MSQIKTDRKYTKTHEWVMDNGDGTFRIGITDNAQEQLGDMVFVELADKNDSFDVTSNVCILESVKAASDVFAPADLTVVTINERLENEPELINSDCYGEGYLFDFKADFIDDLLSAEKYQELLDNE